MTREEFFIGRIAYYIEQGLDLTAARLMAASVTATHWPISYVTNDEHQRDVDEYNEEMSLGGQPFRRDRQSE